MVEPIWSKAIPDVVTLRSCDVMPRHSCVQWSGPSPACNRASRGLAYPCAEDSESADGESCTVGLAESRDSDESVGMWRRQFDVEVRVGTLIATGIRKGCPAVTVNGPFHEEVGRHVCGIDASAGQSGRPRLSPPRFGRSEPMIGDVDLNCGDRRTCR